MARHGEYIVVELRQGQFVLTGKTHCGPDNYCNRPVAGKDKTPTVIDTIVPKSPPASTCTVGAEHKPQKVEKYTRNQYWTLGFDYTFNSEWGVNLQLPYIDRSHSTLAANG